MRQIIISAVAILIVAGSILVARNLSNRNRPKAPKAKGEVPAVFVETVQNGTTAIEVTASGNLAALNRIELYSEVQGIFEYSSGLFEPGIRYKKGAVLLRINSDEHRANLRAQKSNLYNQLVAILPDLRFDYADAHPRWEQYVKDFDVEGKLQPLPEYGSDREKLFIAGKNIVSTWHTVKNLEERLTKYTIYAPFNGVLTESLVDKGALVRTGQKLGEFISPGVYELETSVNAAYADILRSGKSVELTNIEGTKNWRGRVHRVNSLIDPATQTVKAYIRVKGNDLREGMYLEAELDARSEPNSMEVSRKLLIDNDKLFAVRDTVLELLTIEPVYFKEKTVVVRGLPDGTTILNKALPGAYDGMKVKIFDADKG